jgi:Fe-S-cluster-containing dehydrogenase component
VQYGFVIDHGRCIGCHACTVACKSENDVPVGNFRTWVKYTERGEFPEVRRSFAVLRCNQCSDAPCIEICPVRALAKREDGIVDIDPAVCIGCKSCMQACPYDALYINDDTGVAQKCHFCAHRTEVGLAPACAIVCPTEAIIPGDFHDPASVVSGIREAGGLTRRKPEAGTGPNVFYREADPAGIDPSLTQAAGGYLWSNAAAALNLDVERFLELQQEAEESARPSAKTTYDIEHTRWWGNKVSAYLFTKSLSVGLFFVAWLQATFAAEATDTAPFAWGLAALVFLGLTGALLIADLKRPERFFYIFTRSNPRSWLVRGSWIISAYGALLTGWLVARWFGAGPLEPLLRHLTLPAAAATAAYTGWLFGQAKGRVLWMRRGLWAHLIVQAALAGAAVAAFVAGEAGGNRWAIPMLLTLALHALFMRTEKFAAPKGREAEYARALSLIENGPFKERRTGLTWVTGALVPTVAALTTLIGVPVPGAFGVIAGICVLAGLAAEEDLMVRAGQALPIS